MRSWRASVLWWLILVNLFLSTVCRVESGSGSATLQTQQFQIPPDGAWCCISTSVLWPSFPVFVHLFQCFWLVGWPLVHQESWIVCYAVTLIRLKLLSAVAWNSVFSVILHTACSAHLLHRWSIPGSHMRKRYLMGLLLRQKVLQRKGHEIAIPGNVSWNISSSEGKTLILVLLTHSEDCNKIPEAIV